MIYIELHKAKEVYRIVEDSMKLINTVKINPLIKDDIILHLNKIKQYLLLPNLKVIDDTKTNS